MLLNETHAQKRVHVVNMKLTGWSFFFFFCVLPVSGKPLLNVSPGPVFAAVGGEAVLPCDVNTSAEPSDVMAVEWTRVDNGRVLMVVRGGDELVKEKDPEYRGRTAILKGGSLKLLAVQQQDSGAYRCVLLRESTENVVLVSLSVAQVSQVSLSVRRTSDNQLWVQCESSGWSPEPAVSLLDSNRTVLAAETKSSVRPDHLYSVSAIVNVAQTLGSGAVICRVEIPGTVLANENTVHISDELHLSQEGPSWYVVMGGAFILVCVVTAIVVFFVPVWMIKKLRSLARHLTEFCLVLIAPERQRQPEDHPLLGEYGDISSVETSGASEHTAGANMLSVTGVEASNRLAERDLVGMNNYRESIISVGQSLGVAPALIAAIISRQSQAGTKLRTDGFGQSDPNCFGLMQINKHYHAVKGAPRGREHVDQGATFLIQLVKTMRRTKPNWNKEQQLKGALACYISGEDRVIPLAYEDLDSVTPYGDFANDVVARAQWFNLNGF